LTNEYGVYYNYYRYEGIEVHFGVVSLRHQSRVYLHKSPSIALNIEVTIIWCLMWYLLV